MSATRVQFYFNAESPLALACELIDKAYAGGRKVAVRAPDMATAQQLDQLLWTFSQQSFIPHVLAESKLAQETPVIIDSAAHAVDWAHHDMLFNLAPDAPAGFDSFRIVIEIVSQHEEDKRPARARWNQYKSAGLRLQAFDAIRREAL